MTSSSSRPRITWKMCTAPVSAQTTMANRQESRAQSVKLDPLTALIFILGLAVGPSGLVASCLPLTLFVVELCLAPFGASYSSDTEPPTEFVVQRPHALQ